MNIQQILNKASERIDRKDAEILLAFILGVEKTFLYTHPEFNLSPSQRIRFSCLLKKRKNHAPVAYLVRKKSFFGREFIVTPATLIPRPETETLVEYIYSEAKEKKQINIIDVGTGSGAIAITLSLELPNAHVYATDISKSALKVARKNNTKLSGNVAFTKSNLLEQVSGEFDIIVANLPYLAPSDIENSPTKEDLNFEPQIALIAPDDGLHLIKRLLLSAPEKLAANGLLYLELLPRQIASLQHWLHSQNLPLSFEPLKDLSGKDRFVKLKRI